jgi:hypothetical protein
LDFRSSRAQARSAAAVASIHVLHLNFEREAKCLSRHHIQAGGAGVRHKGMWRVVGGLAVSPTLARRFRRQPLLPP